MLVITTSIEVNGGGRRIRTFEAYAAELQSAPFDRSGIPPFSHLLSVRSLLNNTNSLRWCRHTDSNCGPTDYKSVALPTELCRRCVENFTEFLPVRKPKSNRLMQGIAFLQSLYAVFGILPMRKLHRRFRK